jgi:hypothetical protein
MNNLQRDGWDFEDLKYVELSEKELETYRLAEGDLLFNRTNSKELVGKCEVFREPGTWVFASYLIRVKSGPRLVPQFASDFLNSATGRLQIDRLSRQIIGMTNINAEELRSINIPVPPVEMQRHLVAVMDEARESKRRKLDEADALLAGLDEYVLAQLGIQPPKVDERKVYAVTVSALQEQARLNAEYFHPERMLALRALRELAGETRCQRLDEVVVFVRDQIKSPIEPYIGLANVKSHTGEFVDAGEEVSGACSVFRTGDVLFARLRPYLNKVYMAEFSGCCSPEFHVMRSRDPAAVHPDYLAAILRSRIILAQTRQMMTGNTHPRLASDDVVNLIVPIPTGDVQERIASEARRRRVEAQLLRVQAETEWEAAKRQFEEQLLGPV